MKESVGIEKKNREYLDLVNRSFAGPFTINEAAEVLHFEYKKAKRFTAYLASRGWLARVKNGYYKTVPLGTLDPFELKEDPWVLADKVYAPCYIGGFSACSYWGLTEQVFKDTVVFTEKKATGRIPAGFLVKSIPSKRMYGLSPAWINNVKVSVSDPSRTIIDMLNEPAIGGGIRNVSDVIVEYFLSEHRNDEALIKYCGAFGNRVIYKRLGYLLEALKIEAPALLKECSTGISSGFSMLDPSIKTKGRYLKKWNLNVNALIKRESK
ncbi:MAG TPA: hypothetical protein ENN43_03415 [bacterium]|nr:hypothetical protein [bacterium]